MTNTLSSEILMYIKNLEGAVATACEVIKAVPDHNLVALQEIQANILALKEESLNCKEDDMPGIIQQMTLQNQLAERFSTHIALPDPTSPFFGHMRIEQDGKEKDVFIGHIAFSHRSTSFKVIDWKKAPIARIFYQYAENDEFIFDLDNRSIEGVILEKSVLTIRDSKLLRVDRNGVSYINRNGTWSSMDSGHDVLAGGEGKANAELAFGMGNTNFDSPEVISLLDKIQYDIVHGDATMPLLITGGAGSGKTTVALYRIAKLCEKRHLHPSDCLVLVPNSGLVNLSKTLLHNIGLESVNVKTNEELIKEVVLGTIKGMPRKINEETPIAVSTIKRHPLTLKVLRDYVDAQKESVIEKLSSICGDQVISYLNEHRLLPIIPLVRQLYQCDFLTAIEKINVMAELKKLKNYQEDIFNIFTDSKFHTFFKENSSDVITGRMVEELKHHMSLTYNEFDADRDFQSEDPTMDLSGSFDIEDYSLLLKLVDLKNGTIHVNKGRIKTYSHIFIDEAQELSSSELRLVSKTLNQGGNFTVAGDAIQQIDPTMSFTTWDEVLKGLGISDFRSSELNVSYRSPKQIIEFAHTVLGPLAPGKLPETKRIGGPVLKTQVQHIAHASMVISDALVDLVRREPKATVAIICNTEEAASQLYEELADIGGVRLILDQGFNFKPGIDITTVDQIRGLEFDYVIIPDADRVNYPENNRARKRMHLASTRAIHQLWVLHPLERTILF